MLRFAWSAVVPLVLAVGCPGDPPSEGEGEGEGESSAIEGVESSGTFYTELDATPIRDGIVWRESVDGDRYVNFYGVSTPDSCDKLSDYQGAVNDANTQSGDAQLQALVDAENDAFPVGTVFFELAFTEVEAPVDLTPPLSAMSLRVKLQPAFIGVTMGVSFFDDGVEDAPLTGAEAHVAELDDAHITMTGVLSSGDVSSPPDGEPELIALDADVLRCDSYETALAD